MTLDETITLLKFNNKHIADLKNDDLQQIAEWLEELKSYRAHIFSGDMTQKMLKEEYNKSIDDFAEKLNTKCDGMIKDKWNSNVAPISWAEAYADFKDDIDDISEQLKVLLRLNAVMDGVILISTASKRDEIANIGAAL